MSLFDQEATDHARLPDFKLHEYKDTQYLTHNLHPYPAKFIPQIPRRVIEKLSGTRAVVLDPFCGSGTSLVEARILGRTAIGSDINPIAVLVSRAKTMSLSSGQLQLVTGFQKEAFKALSLWKRKGSLPRRVAVPEFPNRAKWFGGDALEELAYLAEEIRALEDDDVCTFLLATLSAIVVKASNQASETKWKAIPKNLAAGDATRLFLEHLNRIMPRAAEYSQRVAGFPEVRVYQADARNLAYAKDGSVDLVVTSPPYMNSYDYYLYHKLRLFILGLEVHETQEKEIGSRNKHSDKGLGVDSFMDEMLQTLLEMRRVLKIGGRLCLVIGDAILRGKTFDMNRIYTTLVEAAGLTISDSFSFDQREYSKAFAQYASRGNKKSHILLAHRG
jgi:site-specific DNA-methyltransferase (cytosine-N4-specific)